VLSGWEQKIPLSHRVWWALLRAPFRLLGSTPRQTAARLDGLYSHLIRAAAQPCGATNDVESVLRNIDRVWDDRRAMFDDPVGMSLAMDCARGLSRTQFHVGDRAASLRATEVVLALRLHQADHDGRLPETLDELVPAYLPAVPRDPFARTDAPLCYRKDGTEWTVYSVGPNGADDGGRWDWTRERYYWDRKQDRHLDEADVRFSSGDAAWAREQYLKDQRERRP
jgi:hypothetical protein